MYNYVGTSASSDGCNQFFVCGS